MTHVTTMAVMAGMAVATVDVITADTAVVVAIMDDTNSVAEMTDSPENGTPEMRIMKR